MGIEKSLYEREGPTVEDQEWLLTELEGWPGDLWIALGGYSMHEVMASVTLGQPRPMWWLRVFPGDDGLAPETLPCWELSFTKLVSVYRQGELAGVMRTFPSSRDLRWTLDMPHGLACAMTIDALGPGDRVFMSPNGNHEAMLVARGNSVWGIEECSGDAIPPVTTVQDYQQYLTDYAAQGGGGIVAPDDQVRSPVPDEWRSDASLPESLLRRHYNRVR